MAGYIQNDYPFLVPNEGSLDKKQYFTSVADMKAFPENQLGKVAMCTCNDDTNDVHDMFIFNINNEVDSVFGKWRSLLSIITDNSDMGLDISETVDSDNTLTDTLNERAIKQTYEGGYIEIQPDSWDGSVPALDSSTKTWGFPISLTTSERARIKADILKGDGTGIMYIRLPLGFAYRGYRNIDETTSLAKNIGERFAGQNNSLKVWFKDISEAGGGLAPEYWCPAPYWVTGGKYNGTNELWAGGTNERTTKLADIKATNETQYNAQIEAFTSAIVDDLEYLHQNIAPVRMFSLQNEPKYNVQTYGACRYDAQTYNDVLAALVPKIKASTILSKYNDEVNEVKIIVASSDETEPWNGIAKTYIDNHSEDIWGYTHHLMRKFSGENGSKYGADYVRSEEFLTQIEGKDNVFCNEYEYFTVDYGTDDFRCSNNMLRMINELVYNGSKVLHPVIHMCKPLGQTLSSTNTKGYCLYETNLNGEYGVDETNENNKYCLAKGTVVTNKTMYNSWKMFNDNLPVGSYVVGEYTNVLNNFGYVVTRYGGKLRIFLANNSDKAKKLTLTFAEVKSFKGLLYNLNNIGTKLKEKNGTTIDFIVPAYSGLVYIENDVNYAILPPVPSEFVLEADFTNATTTSIPDVSGNNRNLELTNCAVADGVITLDGTSIIKVPFMPSNNFEISMKLKYNALDTDDTTMRYFMELGDESQANRLRFCYTKQGTYKNYFKQATSSTNSIIINNASTEGGLMPDELVTVTVRHIDGVITILKNGTVMMTTDWTDLVLPANTIYLGNNSAGTGGMFGEIHSFTIKQLN